MTKEIDWEKVTEERRGKILWIQHSRILDALVVRRQTATRIKRIALPKHYRLRNVHYEPSRASFGFFIESPEFEKIPIGAELPDFARDEVEEVEIEIEKNEKGKKKLVKPR